MDLLDACRERPEDDLPRRVLGDWLMDQPDAASQARGEFIHLDLDVAAGKKLGQWRHAELLAAHQGEWLGPLAGLNAKFDRGLIAVRPASTDDDRLVNLFQRRPAPVWVWVSELRLTNVDARLIHDLAEWPGLAGVATLRVHGPRSSANDPWLDVLTRSRHFRPQALHLHGCQVRHDLLARLFTPVLCLRSCFLIDATIIDATILALREGPLMPRLRLLALPNNHLHAEAVEALATCPGLKGLKSLNLGRNVIGAAGARLLGHATHLDALEELDLRLNGIRDEGGSELYRSPLGHRLRRLNLVSNGVLSPQVQRRWRERLGHGLEL